MRGDGGEGKRKRGVIVNFQMPSGHDGLYISPLYDSVLRI